ncbi:RepB family plasmid replication initiator protein, partial [Acinetobacter baumannii]
INEINEKTDVKATYQQNKKGRSISGFSFTFQRKKTDNHHIGNKRDPNTIVIYSTMTVAQRHLFANNLSQLPEMGKYS